MAGVGVHMDVRIELHCSSRPAAPLEPSQLGEGPVLGGRPAWFATVFALLMLVPAHAVPADVDAGVAVPPTPSARARSDPLVEGSTPAAAPALVLARVAPVGLVPHGYLVSEKLDGVRAYWDGRVLRSRSGALLNVPEWFLTRLPAGMELDGELWLGRGRFDEMAALLRRREAGDAVWRQVRFMVFELPGAAGDFGTRSTQIGRLVERLDWPQLQAVAQRSLPDRAALEAELQRVLQAGGEGLVLHRADAAYVTGRSDVLYKLKPQQDAEAVVVGHRPGRGRLAGRIGALRVRDDAGREFLIGSGLSDAQRDAPPPIGTRVTFVHRGETRHGLPRFATFLRVRDEP